MDQANPSDTFRALPNFRLAVDDQEVAGDRACICKRVRLAVEEAEDMATGVKEPHSVLGHLQASLLWMS
jgi:hypothetical protein